MNEDKSMTLIKTKETDVNTNTAEKDKNTYVLKKPFEYEGKTHTEFKFDFDKLSGFDMIDAERELRDMGIYVISPESDTAFIITIAAKASNISSNVLSALPISDFMAIKRMTQRFLNGRD